MKKSSGYNVFQLASGVLMIVTLAWLTISTPFVYEHHVAMEAQISGSEAGDVGFDPLATTQEEKSEGGNNNASEYLHDTHQNEDHYIEINTNNRCHFSDIYYAFHPELISPPPESLS